LCRKYLVDFYGPRPPVPQSEDGDWTRSILEVLESGSYVLGPQLKEFEAELATYCNTKEAVRT